MSNVSLVDPRYVDGEPWEVAAVAGEQTKAAIQLAIEALEGLTWAARGSWLTQEHYRTGKMPDRGAFEASPLGQRLESGRTALYGVSAGLKQSVSAAAYDPRSWT